MRLLLSVPPALARSDVDLVGEALGDCFVSHDPIDAKLGSGGGTVHLLRESWRAEGSALRFAEWLGADSRIIVHAGGQSRRLAAYAPIGKALLPVPVFRWRTGQRIDQTLGALQIPFLRRLASAGDGRSRTVVASGDVLVWHEDRLPDLPSADVICLGLWDSAETATGHGVFFVPRENPDRFDFMLQKPSVSEISRLSKTHLFLLDVGIWILSQRAVEVLLAKAGWDPDNDPDGVVCDYDLYGSFGPALGTNPTAPDPAVSALEAAVVPLDTAEFHHFGTNRDLIGSALGLQNRVSDQRRILSPMIKPHPSIFIQNADAKCPLGPENRRIWIENSTVPESWNLRERHVITGVPENEWRIDLPEGVCIDFVPLEDGRRAFRCYGFDDPFRGAAEDPATLWMGRPAREWFRCRDLPVPEAEDLQEAPLFPVAADEEWTGDFLRWMIDPSPAEAPSHARFYRETERLAAGELAVRCDIDAVSRERRRRLAASLPVLARHAVRSVFRQIDLFHAARLAAEAEPGGFPDGSTDVSRDLYSFIRDKMFRSALERFRGRNGDREEAEAFRALREAIVAPYRRTAPRPRRALLSDQVVWARSPVRLDLAGGWTDTPPHCFLNGGRVVNLAVELNGQPPVQVFVRSGDVEGIVLRSIDLGSEVVLRDYDDIGAYSGLGSGFAIPRAALALCGFHPEFQSGAGFSSLREQLGFFGGGLEISLLCAVPKGSGLGTSSILSAAVLACLSECAGLGWDVVEIGNRVLAMEQMLTSGGGWQDQFGGAVRGLKLLETGPGLDQTPDIRWLPGHLFTDPEHRARTLLYYTGVTRTARDLLGEIVRGMFLNRSEHLVCLGELAEHARDVYDCVQKGSFQGLGLSVERTWELNRRLDPGTDPPEIRRMLEPIQDWVLGKKLLGAGGGGYLLLFAKDPEAAARVRRHWTENPPNERARFIDFSLSETGLQVTRS